jgi:hypothetical protein
MQLLFGCLGQEGVGGLYKLNDNDYYYLLQVNFFSLIY